MKEYYCPLCGTLLVSMGNISTNEEESQYYFTKDGNEFWVKEKNYLRITQIETIEEDYI